MNEVKFKANKKDLEAIGGEIQEATAALDTTDATAGQVLKVETPGEAPVWGEAGGGGVLEVILTPTSQTSGTINKTWSEIADAMEDGTFVFISDTYENRYYPISGQSLRFINTAFGTDETGNVPVLTVIEISPRPMIGNTAQVTQIQYKMEYMS